MKRNSNYFSNNFLNVVWPEFSSRFKKEITKELYFSDICEFSDYIKKDITLATTTDCEYYIGYLDDRGLKYSTKIKKIREISSVYSFLSQHPELIGKPTYENPMAPIALEDPDNSIREESILDIITLDRLINYLADKDIMCLISLILSLKLMLKTSEIVLLKKCNFFYDKWGNVQLQVSSDFKGSRYIRLPDDILPPLLQYLDSIPADQFIFFNTKQNKPYTVRTLQKRVARAFHAIDSKSYNLNEIRNTGIYLCFNSGATAKQIADTIGYTSTTHLGRLECRLMDLPNKGVDLNMVALKFKTE